MVDMRLSRYWTYRCRNVQLCECCEFHTHHLSWWGRFYFRWLAR